MSEQTFHPIFPVVSIVDNKLFTTSLNVAEAFGKRHAHVLDAIKAINVPEGFFHQPIFRLMIHKVAIGKGAFREDPVYEITRDGFIFLVMGFTGEKAEKIKWAYIAEFNRMEEALSGGSGKKRISVESQGLDVSPELEERMVEAQIGVKHSHRVQLWSIACQMTRLDDGAPKNKAAITVNYCMLCESVREKDVAQGLNVSEPIGDVRDFISERCVLRRDLSTDKESLFNAWQEYAMEQSIYILRREQFFTILRKLAPVHNRRPVTSIGNGRRGRRYMLDGIALAAVRPAADRAMEVTSC